MKNGFMVEFVEACLNFYWECRVLKFCQPVELKYFRTTIKYWARFWFKGSSVELEALTAVRKKCNNV